MVENNYFSISLPFLERKIGLQIKINAIRKHIAKSHLKVAYALYEEDQILIDDSKGNRCAANTTVYNPLDYKQDTQIDDTTEKAQGQDIIFNEGHCFDKNVRELIKKNHGKKNYYVMFQVLERQEPKVDGDGDGQGYGNGMNYGLIGWFLFRLDNEEGQLNIGMFSRALFAPSLRKPPLDMDKIKLMEIEIEFMINEFPYADDKNVANLTKEEEAPEDEHILPPGPKRGLQVEVNVVGNYVAKSHLKVSYALYEEDQLLRDDSKGSVCVANTSVHKPFDEKAQGEDIIFNEGCVFHKDLGSLIKKNDGKMNYSLMLQVLEKPELKVDGDGQSYDTGMEYELFGWLLFRLTDSRGRFKRCLEASTLRKPSEDMNMDMIELRESWIEFTVNDIILTENKE